MCKIWNAIKRTHKLTNLINKQLQLYLKPNYAYANIHATLPLTCLEMCIDTGYTSRSPLRKKRINNISQMAHLILIQLEVFVLHSVGPIVGIAYEKYEQD